MSKLVYDITNHATKHDALDKAELFMAYWGRAYDATTQVYYDATGESWVAYCSRRDSCD
jgi:phage tail sheath protein FI